MYNIAVDVLVGKTLKSVIVSKDKDEIIFTTTTDNGYKMYHRQDCCEKVLIEDICGDLEDLIGSPILKAEETTNCKTALDDSTTWTFYNFSTAKGYVTIRWYGTSNGYYSESVDFCEEEI